MWLVGCGDSQWVVLLREGCWWDKGRVGGWGRARGGGGRLRLMYLWVAGRGGLDGSGGGDFGGGFEGALERTHASAAMSMRRHAPSGALSLSLKPTICSTSPCRAPRRVRWGKGLVVGVSVHVCD